MPSPTDLSAFPGPEATGSAGAVGGADDGPGPARRSRRGHGRTTLADVALQAQVTKITVSRYLREPGKVAPETAQRIRQALARTGYTPNKLAGLLASGRSGMVAALVPNLSHSIFGETVQTLSEALQAVGLELLLAATGYSQSREEAQLRAVLAWAPAAIVITGRRHTAGAMRLLRAAAQAGTPVLEVWDHHPGARAPFAQIGFNHAAVGQAMAGHLLDRGHRRLVYLDSAVAEDFRAHERGAGFAQAVRAAGGEVWRLEAEAGDPFDAGRRALQALQALGLRAPGAGGAAEPPIAVACANDQLACGLMMQAQDQGLRLPADLAVLGFGDFPIGRQLRPALSTVQPPSQAIGQATAQALVKALQDGESPRSLALPWRLIVRGSCA